MITTARQVKMTFKKLGLSQLAAARFLGISPRQCRRIVAGEATIDPSAAKLLAIMLKRKLTPEVVDKL